MPLTQLYASSTSDGHRVPKMDFHFSLELHSRALYLFTHHFMRSCEAMLFFFPRLQNGNDEHGHNRNEARSLCRCNNCTRLHPVDVALA